MLESHGEMCFANTHSSVDNCTVSVPRREEWSTGKYQHEVKGVPEGAARGNPSTECWYFPVLPDSSQGIGIIQFLKVMYLILTLQVPLT